MVEKKLGPNQSYDKEAYMIRFLYHIVARYIATKQLRLQVIYNRQIDYVVVVVVRFIVGP